ncbi:MAG: hypothetical protein Q9191_001459 [Dirinaria sp. TL-2023a]
MSAGTSGEPEATSIHDVPPGPYTARRLQHATAQHLHLTTRRCFIGPVPEGWLKSHRKSWYGDYLNLSNYSSRAATFSASSDYSHQRQITGLDGPSASAALHHSFPQPDDASNDEDAESEEEGRTENSDEGEDAVETSHQEAQEPRQLEASPNRSRSPKPQSPLKGKYDTKNCERSPNGRSYITAPTQSRRKRHERFASVDTTQSPFPSSFVTAYESPKAASKAHSRAVEQASPPQDSKTAYDQQRASPRTDHDAASSTASLLQHGQPPAADTPSPHSFQAQPNPLGTRIESVDTAPDRIENSHAAGDLPEPSKVATPGLIRFNIPDDVRHEDTETQAKLTHIHRHRSWRRRHGQSRPGQIVKMEKMLVRMDSTMQELDADYDENDSLKVEARTIEKWREYVVVCRESTSEDTEYTIQMYKTRVIPAVEETYVQKGLAHEIPLKKRATRINMYSSLDKTLVLWLPWKRGSAVYILRTRSSASAVEWYTFIRGVLGRRRTTTLQVNVPDLSVSLKLDNPFGHLESSSDAVEAAKGNEEAIARTMQAERAIAGEIVSQCIQMLEKSPEWSDILRIWLKHEKMGLAWKRYDRLEWVHGANEQKMYGTMAMHKSHELELRPKQHYPTAAKNGAESLEEPAPVEGFLIRLTSQRGRTQRLGKMFFKRLYFGTHNQYLCYCRPAKALPPPPPTLKLNEDKKIPSPSQIVDKTPLIYAVNPYPVKNGQVEWMSSINSAARARRDDEAYKEAERNVNTMLRAEGYVNLSHVTKVRNVQRGATPADENVDEGPDVNFHEDVPDTRRDDGKTDQFEDDRTFEMVLKNGLIIRLQAFNEQTKKEWMSRLEKLITYWKLRLAGDVDLFKQIRQANLKSLDIDEESEAYLGQFGRKWEVTRSIASPQLFNMCGISCCRAITLAGTLYHKPRRHTTFLRVGVILCHGQLLIYRGTLRERTGKEMPHIQHERENAIDLKDCYIYSGLITEGDLLYQNQTFDSNRPGHHALPRVYLEDGWTSTDEDTMTCFVIWQARKRSFFKAKEDQGEGKTRQRFRYVSQLGVPGRSIVFKTRSRAERDHWVLSIGMEIERLQQGEDIRVISKN